MLLGTKFIIPGHNFNDLLVTVYQYSRFSYFEPVSLVPKTRRKTEEKKQLTPLYSVPRIIACDEIETLHRSMVINFHYAVYFSEYLIYNSERSITTANDIATNYTFDHEIYARARTAVLMLTTVQAMANRNEIFEYFSSIFDRVGKKSSFFS